MCKYNRMSISFLSPADAGTPADAGQVHSHSAPLSREALTPQAAGELAAVMKAMADPVRLRLLSLIASHHGGEVCVCELTEHFDVSQPTISHHLKKLKEVGLVDSERRATWVYYWIIPAAMNRLSALLGVEPSSAAPPSG
jgi:ArsR family transcriptional regulator, arsenate/arsenite/antimonite-responsive transcriptional repressor